MVSLWYRMLINFLHERRIQNAGVGVSSLMRRYSLAWELYCWPRDILSNGYFLLAALLLSFPLCWQGPVPPSQFWIHHWHSCFQASGVSSLSLARFSLKPSWPYSGMLFPGSARCNPLLAKSFFFFKEVLTVVQEVTPSLMAPAEFGGRNTCGLRVVGTFLSSA